MATSTLLGLAAHGQSIWLDYIQRALLTGGGFRRLVDADGVSGVTSNPAILEKAIVEHRDYDAEIRALSGLDPRALYEHIAVEDLQMAADLLHPVYEASRGRDGYVSFEVSPHLAYDTQATVREARRLWGALDRPNSLIKVPATAPGIAAIQQLITEGINVNVTLLFGLQRYREVAQAYLAGLEARVAQGKPLPSVTSVASFFLSRIDTLVDRRLDALTADVSLEKAAALRGRTAIASARLAYQAYRELFSGERWQRLDAAGAGKQRLLWASTSTKDPAYSDTKYVDALIGAETINTLPMATLDAYRDHGHPEARLETDIEAAYATLAGLAQLGIDLQALTDQLEREGVQKFIDAFDKLLDNLARRTPVPAE
jgi:transaldolase